MARYFSNEGICLLLIRLTMTSAHVLSSYYANQGMDCRLLGFPPISNESARQTYRELTEEEIAQVDGGVANIGIGATAGAIFGGAQFLMSDDRFSWSGFAFGIGSGAVSGAISSMGGFGFAFYGGGLGAVGGLVANRLR